MKAVFKDGGWYIDGELVVSCGSPFPPGYRKMDLQTGEITNRKIPMGDVVQKSCKGWKYQTPPFPNGRLEAQLTERREYDKER